MLATAPARVPAGKPDTAATTGLEVVVIPDLTPLVAAIGSGRITAAGIDIPIGLAEREPRRCDIEARRLLGPRRNSVFPAPARCVLAAATYDEACALSRRVCGKGISKQLYNILPKIREVDAAVAANPGLPDHLFEMCPELSFATLAGAPMTHSKRSATGRAERRDALFAVFGEVSQLVAPPPAGAAPDDVLDALAGLWTARRVAAGAGLRLGGGNGSGDGSVDGGEDGSGGAQVDGTGLRMEVTA